MILAKVLASVFGFSLGAAERTYLWDREPLPPCEGGVLHLDGKYRTTTEVEYHDDCLLRGAPGTEVEVDGKIHFLANARLQGSIVFTRAPDASNHRRCVDIEGSLDMSDVDIEFRGCGGPETEDGGALYVEGRMDMSNGSVVFRNGSAMWGGCLFVGQRLFMAGGLLRFEHCVAGELGGGVYAQGDLVQSGGHLHFANCHAYRGKGGALHLAGTDLLQENGKITLSNCWAGNGGCICSNKLIAKTNSSAIADMEDFQGKVVLNGTLVAGGGSADYKGGVIFAASGELGGRMTLRNCKARVGGCLHFKDFVVQASGRLSVMDSHAESEGGCLLATHLRVTGAVSFAHCRAGAVYDGEGGAAKVHGLTLLPGGKMTFTNAAAVNAGALSADFIFQLGGSVHFANCSARHGGGAINALWLAQRHGNMTFSNCSAQYGGAVIAVSLDQLLGTGHLRNRGGPCSKLHPPLLPGGSPPSMAFHSCTAEQSGGAVRAEVIQQEGRMSFDNCHARSGGAVKASRNRPKKEGSNSVRWSSNNEHSCINKLRRNVKGTMVIKGKIDFSRCWADSGGAIRTHTSVNMSTGSASFRSCTANAFGGAIFSKNVYLSQDVSFSEVTALSGGLIFARGEVKMLGGRVMNCSPPQVMAEQRLEIANVSFTGTTQVRLGAPDISAERVQCQNGLRSFKSDKDQGCSRCDENGLQIDRGPVLDNRVNITECVPGPRGALRVESGYLKMKVGHMVDPRNVSRGFFCPNRYACIGGKASVDGSSPMCDAGYEGLGCVECSAAYGPSDSNSLVCVPCAESQMQRINQLARFFLQDLVLFCLSAGGVASSTGRQKVSAVLTNQFMSFAAVAGPVLLAVRQTESFKHAAYSLDEYVDGLSTLVQVGEGASTGGMSVNCILRYLGFSPTWQAEALLTLLTPACAMLALTAIRGLRIAIVVGVNCFLAKICLFFGRYLVCFRMEPEDLGGEVICEYVRHTSLSFASLMTIVVVVMVAGPISWVVLLNDERNTKAGFYLYLTAQYRDEVKFWEVTRLVRKILLAVICAVYPITLHPLTQILCISLILLAALVMEMRFLPYLSHSWNSSEQMLLVISMAMVCITSFYLANERHWSTSRSSQCVLLSVILALTIGPSYMQVTLILRQLLRERFGE